MALFGFESNYMLGATLVVLRTKKRPPHLVITSLGAEHFVSALT